MSEAKKIWGIVVTAEQQEIIRGYLHSLDGTLRRVVRKRTRKKRLHYCLSVPVLGQLLVVQE